MLGGRLQVRCGQQQQIKPSTFDLRPQRGKSPSALRLSVTAVSFAYVVPEAPGADAASDAGVAADQDLLALALVGQRVPVGVRHRLLPNRVEAQGKR